MKTKKVRSLRCSSSLPMIKSKISGNVFGLNMRFTIKFILAKTSCLLTDDILNQI